MRTVLALTIFAALSIQASHRMRTLLLLVVLMLLTPMQAGAAGEWFPVTLLDDQVMVMNSDGTTADVCIKHQLEIERDLKKKYPSMLVRCSRMTQKVYSTNADGVLDRTYQFSWMGDFVNFTEVTSLALCKKQKANLARINVDLDFFCAESPQLIK